MQIHELKVAKRVGRKRIGRGGKRGTTAGRGQKGQKSRSGSSVDPLFEGGRSTFIERMKKTRGFKSPRPKNVVVTLAQLDKAFKEGEEVSLESLTAKRLVTSRAERAGIKIVATGKLSKKLIFGGTVILTAGAKAVVEKAGGKVAA